MPGKRASHKLGETCPRCGVMHTTRTGKPACVGHSRSDPNRACTKAPDTGQHVCGTHGGMTPSAIEKGKQCQQRRRMEQLVITLGEPVPDSDPGEVVAERIDARRGHVRWLLARVQDLEPDALIWGRTKSVSGDVVVGNGPSASLDRALTETEESKPHVWYDLYIDAARDLERLCIDAIRAGLEERRVRVSEQYADMWVRVIDGMLRELGHDPNDPQTAEIVARHLEIAVAA